MTDTLAVAIVGALIAVVTAAIVPLLVSLNRRTRHLERQNRLAWLYIKRLIDHAYRYSDTTANPLPQPPEGWLDDDQ